MSTTSVAEVTTSTKSAASVAETLEHNRLKWLNYLPNKTFHGNFTMFSVRLASDISTDRVPKQQPLQPLK